MRFSSKSVIAAAAAVSVLFLGACGTQDPNTSATPSADPSSSAGPASPSPSPSPSASVEPSKDLSAVKTTGAFG